MKSLLHTKRDRDGFSLIEVVLAIGIFLITILALVGLIGPTLKSIEGVQKVDEVESVVNTVNAFLQSSPEINPGASRFDAVYNAVRAGDEATIFVYRQYTDATGNDIRLRVGFLGETAAILVDADFDNLAGPVYRVVLTASPATPEPDLSSATRNANGILTLRTDLADYNEGYFAMEIRIFDIEEDTLVSARGSGAVPPAMALATLNGIEPIFTYNTAIVR